MTIKAHIVAFNANEYCDRLGPLYPDVEFSCDLTAAAFADAIYECEILIAFGVMLNGEIF